MTAATIAGHSNKSEYSKKNGYRKSSKTPWGNPIVYFFSLVLVAICITPVLYIIFGGFRTNSQITNHPSGMPNPWIPFVQQNLKILLMGIVLVSLCPALIEYIRIKNKRTTV